MKTPAWKMSRRRFLGGVSIAAVGTFGYARFFEAERLQVSHHTVPLGGGARRPLKLLHLSDLHASGVVGLDYIESAIDRALAWRPEVICLTGDFITQRFERAATFGATGEDDGHHQRDERERIENGAKHFSHSRGT